MGAAATTPTDFYTQRFSGCLSLHWNCGLCSLPGSPVVPVYSHTNVRPTGPPSAALLTLVFQPLPCHMSSPPTCPSPAPTSLDECFFFNCLVVGLLYSSIFWLFFIFIFNYILLIVLLQLSHFPCFIPLHPAQPLPPTFPPLVHIHG